LASPKEADGQFIQKAVAARIDHFLGKEENCEIGPCASKEGLLGGRQGSCLSGVRLNTRNTQEQEQKLEQGTAAAAAAASRSVGGLEATEHKKKRVGLLITPLKFSPANYRQLVAALILSSLPDCPLPPMSMQSGARR